ncbi:proline/serine-rich coiled-coil protein 1 isoform X11 [Gallus gallus]|uniref:proline/serine-rich coiled-coil protein 1 isoform X11 n=1 Tax=Gallus gallus TaxID=9031 RepID=UPI001AEAF4FB|nr:proline/serine-rich coiled-coil protein 1 isoform X11 [Gallus gallus]XP_040547383.1 proline/serine-rich coiled-coil protein 1 isoform X11 [Gallus gallus]
MMEERDVQFITEEKFDFGVLSPSDSREDDDDDEEPPGGANGRWSPLSGAGLEEMVREATRLAAQLQQCQLSPLPPGQGRGSPRSPRRETFVVKDSPVRALLPTVPAAGVPKESLRSHPPASPRGAPSSRGTPSQSGSPRPCPPRGAVARGRSEPLRAGTAAKAEEQHCHPPDPHTPCQDHHHCHHRPQQPPPPRLAPSPNPPAGLRHRGLHQVGGDPPGPAQLHPEVHPSGGGLAPGADLAPPAAACSPPARRQPAAPRGDSIAHLGKLSHGEGGSTVRPPRGRRQRLRSGFALITKGHTSSRKPPRPTRPAHPGVPPPPPRILHPALWHRLSLALGRGTHHGIHTLQLPPPVPQHSRARVAAVCPPRPPPGGAGMLWGGPISFFFFLFSFFFLYFSCIF